MSDYTELKRLAFAAMAPKDSPHLPCTVAFDRAANPAAVLRLIAENKRLSELLECSQGDMRQANRIMERDMKDAERYRFLRKTDSWADIDFDDHGLWIVNARDDVLNQDGEQLDAAVDAAMAQEAK